MKSRMRPHLLFVLLVSGCLGSAHADDVYKCTSASGEVAYQDHACPNDASEATVHLLPPPLPPAAQDQPAADDPAAAPPLPANVPPAAGVERPPPPQMFVCARAEDGTQYMSDDGAPPIRQVPAGVLGASGKGLADAYGGRNGIGVSAPGVRRIPVDPSPQASAATNYVSVQDQCVPASTETTCNYLRAEYDKLHEKLRRAFKDERAVLEPRLDDLDARLSGC
jgi:hypothetical protein